MLIDPRPWRRGWAQPNYPIPYMAALNDRYHLKHIALVNRFNIERAPVAAKRHPGVLDPNGQETTKGALSHPLRLRDRSITPALTFSLAAGAAAPWVGLAHSGLTPEVPVFVLVMGTATCSLGLHLFQGLLVRVAIALASVLGIALACWSMGEPIAELVLVVLPVLVLSLVIVFFRDASYWSLFHGLDATFVRLRESLKLMPIVLLGSSARFFEPPKARDHRSARVQAEPGSIPGEPAHNIGWSATTQKGTDTPR